MEKFLEKLLWVFGFIFFMGMAAGGCVACWYGNRQPLELSDYDYNSLTFPGVFLVNPEGFLESWLGLFFCCLGLVFLADMFTPEKTDGPPPRTLGEQESLKLLLGGFASLAVFSALAVLAWQRFWNTGDPGPEGDLLGIALVLLGIFPGGLMIPGGMLMLLEVSCGYELDFRAKSEKT